MATSIMENPLMAFLPSTTMSDMSMRALSDAINPEESEAEREEALLLWYSGALFFMAFVFFLVHRYLRWARISDFLTEGSDVCAWGSLWFAFSVTMVVYNNFILKSWQGGFAFPLMMSMVHMWLKLFLSVLIVRKCSTHAYAAANDPSKNRVLVPWSIYLFSAVPVGIATALDIGASNASFLFVSVPFYTVVKSSSLVFVLFFSILYRLQPFRWSLITVTGIICVGVLMASYGDPKFDLLGFVLVLAAAAVGGLRWALTERLMDFLGSKMNSIMTIYTISPAAAITLVPFALWLEGNSLMTSKFMTHPDLFVLALLNTICAGFFAFAMIFVELALLHRTSSMTLSVIGYVKQILQIVISVLIFNNKLTPLNIAGMFVTFIGIVAYNFVQRSSTHVRLGKTSGGTDFVEDTFEENFEGLTFVVNALDKYDGSNDMASNRNNGNGRGGNGVGTARVSHASSLDIDDDDDVLGSSSVSRRRRDGSGDNNNNNDNSHLEDISII